MAMKTRLLLLITLLMLPAASTFSFGTFSYQDSKQVTDTNVTFTLGMVNAGNSSVTVRMSASGLENGTGVFPRQSFVLEPSEVSENPRGDGWMAVKAGRYAKVEEVPFRVVMDDKTDERFQVRAEARLTEGGDGSGIRPEAVQVREHDFSLSYPDDKRPRVDRGYTGGDSEEEDNELRLIRENASEENTTVTESRETEDENRTSNPSKTSKTGGNSTSTGKGIGTTTVVLALGAAGSMIYLWTVI